MYNGDGMMKYQEALDYLDGFHVNCSVPSQDSLRRLCECLGKPQETLTFINMTKIDSSTQAYVASIMKCAGYRVGRYLSLTIFEDRERIRVNDCPITRNAFCQGMELLRSACDSITEKGFSHPASLEMETALAFWYFREKKCDFVLSENGSGDVLVNAAKCSEITGIKYGLECQRFHYDGYKNLEISLSGKSQIGNAALAIEIVKTLDGLGYAVKEAAIRQGLRETKVPGCFQVVGKKPYFVTDRVENEKMARELAENIKFYFADKRIIFIMGFLRNMEYERIIELLSSYAAQIIAVTPPYNADALAAYDLALDVAKLHPNVTAVDSPEEAVEISRLFASKEDVILAFGSPSYLGKLIRLLEKK